MPVVVRWRVLGAGRLGDARPHSPIGRGRRLKIVPVRVRIPVGAPPLYRNIPYKEALLSYPRLIVADGRTNESLERTVVGLIRFEEINAPPAVALQLCGEDVVRILERRSVDKYELHLVRENVADTDDSVQFPDW